MPTNRGQLESFESCADSQATPIELADWKAMIRQMPEVRIEKVQAVRAALQSNQYDEQLYLDRAIDAISRDLPAF
ncbi:MAG: flagellar biosynthesis anti-sigma factor FlgM [Planctomycetes bacterium]|nr:flagellar biosynthesis anti-sigma factor FlgM [Planctomycetota bacterium]MBI3832757.1 flagellar biosynthesis anti-sigma factor FlgM [Planctomycetota bacterium]